MSFYRFIDAERARWSVRILCRVLGVARSAYYDWLEGDHPGRKPDEASLSVHIKAIWRRSRGTYGVPRVHAELRAEGHRVGRHRVARLMREFGLTGTPKRRFRGSTTDSNHDNRIAENLLQRDFRATRPNQVWVGDITYLPTTSGWVYLAVLIDLFSRKVVGWALEPHMRTDLCLSAFKRAVAARVSVVELIHHTDRGSQYTSDDYQKAVSAVGAVPSMSRKGDCWDNAVAESFFGTLEQELVGRLKRPWRGPEDARADLSGYIHGFYNGRRRHSTIGFMSPVDFERSHVMSEAVAA